MCQLALRPWGACTIRKFLLSSAVPELPELEVAKAKLRVSLAGRRITHITLTQFPCLKTSEPKLESLQNAHILSVTRLGQFLCFSTDNSLHLCIRLTPHGSMLFCSSDQAVTPEQLLCLRLDHGLDLRFVEPGFKNRTQVYLVTSPRRISPLAGLGPDPLTTEFTISYLRQALIYQDRPVKRLLTDQRTLAGIGNCYADEIIYEAKLSPIQNTAELRAEEAIRLYTAIKKVLNEAILNLKALDHLPSHKDRTFLRVYNRLGQPCLNCNFTIQRVRYAETSSYYCPGCQTGGKVLVDQMQPHPKDGQIF